MADINIKARYIIVGEKAPKNSRFKGVVTIDKIFGNSNDSGIKSYFDYTARESAKDDDLKNNEINNFDSLLDYTSRLTDANNFTFTHLGFLNDKNKIKQFVDESKYYLNEKGSCIYDLVISFKSFEDALKYGIKTNEDWAKKIYKLIPKVAIKLGFDPSNIGYWMDYHSKSEKGKKDIHPHIHLAFFEKIRSKDLGNDNLSKDTLKMLKREIIKYIMLEDNLKYNFEKIDKIKKEIRDKVLKINLKNDLEIINFLKEIKNEGRLQYNSIHIKPFRKKLDYLVEKILDNDENIKIIYKEFIKNLKDYDKLLNESNNTNVSKVFENEDKKFKEFLANYILSFKKIENKLMLDNILKIVETNGNEKDVLNLYTQNIDDKTLIKDITDDKITLEVTRSFYKKIILNKKSINDKKLNNKNEVLKENRLIDLKQKQEFLLFIRAIQKRISEIEKEIDIFISNQKEF